MMTNDEKRFLKWLVIAGLWGILVWVLTDWGLLASTGAGVTLFLICHGVYRYRNEGAAKESTRHAGAAYTALYRKFGRWTYVAQYGPLGLIGVGGYFFRNVPGKVSGYIFFGSLWFFFLWGLYLCWLVADYKADLTAELEAQ